MHKRKLLISGIIAIITIISMLMFLAILSLGGLNGKANKQSITISTASFEQVYDGQSLRKQEWSILSGKLKDGDKILATMESEITYVGATDNLIKIVINNKNGQDVTNAYDISYVIGNLRITKKELYITTVKQEKVYDGNMLETKTEEVKVNGLIENHMIQFDTTSSMIPVGSETNEVSISVIDYNNDDVTENYEIIYAFDDLVITPVKAVLKTETKEKIYDGILLENTIEPTISNLLPNHKAVYSFNKGIKNVGEIENSVTVKIYNQFNQDVTTFYEISNEFGSLSVLPFEITLVSLGKTKVFDGKILENKEIEEPFNLIEGHELEPFFTESILYPGEIQNVFLVKIYEKMTNDDVTENYDITYIYGHLTILTSIYATGKIHDQSFSDFKDDDLVAEINKSTSESLYLRERSYGNYGDGIWDEGKKANIETKISPLFYTGQAINKNNTFARSNLTIEHIRDQVPFLIPYHMITDIENTNDVYIKNEKKDTYIYDYIPYNVFNRGYVEIKQDYLEDEKEYYELVVSQYLNIPDKYLFELNKIIEDSKIKIDLSNDKNQMLKEIKNFANYLRTIFQVEKKNLNDNNDTDILLDFLDKKKGTTQHFTTAATLLFRQLDIPARYTTGYYIKGNEKKIFEKNAHTWVEVYIEKMGWIPVEVSPEITENEITVTPEKIIEQYSQGMSFKPEKVKIDDFEKFQAKGYTYEIISSDEITVTPGYNEIFVSEIRIYDDNYYDVTSDFSITYKKGTAQFYLKQITFTTATDTKDYDGKPLINDLYELDQLFDGHSEIIGKALAISSFTSVTNQRSIKIVDNNGNNVTGLYLINNKFGKLTLKRKEISIESESMTKKYDGKELVHHQIKPIIGLLEGHTVQEITFTGRQESLGNSENEFTDVMIVDATGNDVTRNYNIEYIFGELRIEK